MSEVIHDTHEFWRPPVADEPVMSVQAGPVLVEACDDCGTEFMVGARFCYICGAPRVSQENSPRARPWISYLEFQNVREGFLALRRTLALSSASLIAFLIGAGCLLAALAVGFIYAVQNFADFQAIQYWRVEWLLAAMAAFLAGMMLKHSDHNRG